LLVDILGVVAVDVARRKALADQAGLDGLDQFLAFEPMHTAR